MMKGNIINKLERGKASADELNDYAAAFAQDAKKLSAVRLCLNLPLLHEQYVKRNMFKNEQDRHNIEELADITSEVLSEENSSICSKAFEFRKKNVSRMHVLSAFADRFTVYEYVLNRIEYRFTTGILDDDYSDEQMTKKILDRLSSEKDKSAAQALLVSVIEQLPVRMTKAKFFQSVADGLNAYSGSEKATVDSMIFMLRTAATLAVPDGFEDEDELTRVVRIFEDINVSLIDVNEYEKLHNTLIEGMKKLDDQMDVCILMQEIINDVCVLSLHENSASDESDICIELARSVMNSFSNDNIDDIIEKYEAIEGIQERCIAAYEPESSVIDEISDSYKENITENGLEDTFDKLLITDRLLSTSRFADMEISAKSEKADNDYIERVTADFIRELDTWLGKTPKIICRAVMAKIITMLPLFITNFQQLEEYVYTSLSSCQDMAEKNGCIEIINGLLSEQEE